MNNKALFLALSITAILCACGDETTNNVTETSGLISRDNLGTCTDKNANEMVYVPDSATVFYCAGGTWHTLNGSNGINGTNGKNDTVFVHDSTRIYDTTTVFDTTVVYDSTTVFDTTIVHDTTTIYDTTVVYNTTVVYDTTVALHVPEYDTVTTEFLNQEMLAEGKYGILIDKRDNKLYRTIEIGTQTWMAQNLDYSDGGVVSSCYNSSLDSCKKYGRIYTWAAAMNLDFIYNTSRASSSDGGDSILHFPAEGLCPAGYHVPDSTEWDKLHQYVTAYNTVNNLGEGVGTSLKSTKSWTIPEGGVAGTDRFGLSIVAGGIINNHYRSFSKINNEGSLWSSTENRTTPSRLSTHVYRFGVFAGNEDAYAGGGEGTEKTYGLGLRCLKNNP